MNIENRQWKRGPRKAPTVPYAKQNLILQHKHAKDGLKPLEEKLAYEAGRAAAELLLTGHNNLGESNRYTLRAEDVLSVIYEMIESGEIKVQDANKFRSNIEKLLQAKVNQLHKPAITNRKRVARSKPVTCPD